jgi:hypothetical protein
VGWDSLLFPEARLTATREIPDLHGDDDDGGSGPFIYFDKSSELHRLLINQKSPRAIHEEV